MDKFLEIKGLLKSKQEELANLLKQRDQIFAEIYQLQDDLKKVCPHSQGSLKPHLWYDPDLYYDEGIDVYHFRCDICNQVLRQCCPDCLAPNDLDACGEGEDADV